MFKVSKLESGFYSILLLIGIILAAIYGNMMTRSPLFFIVSIGVILFATIAFFRSLRTPLIAFEEKGFSIRSNLFTTPEYYEFHSIKHVRALQSDHVLEFERIQDDPVSITLRHLSKKDRIRFIFLLESDVNRKHVSN